MSETTNQPQLPPRGNFVVDTYMFVSKMEEVSQKYITSAGDREKDLEELWKTSNKKKQQKQLELAHNYKMMAFVSTAFLVTSLACQVGSISLHSQAQTDLQKQAADLLNSFGDKGSSFGSRVADNISTQQVTSTNSLIDELALNSTKIWEADRRSNETRKEELKNLKEKLNNSIRDLLEKTSMSYSNR
jgi:hypothetical protein